MWSDPNRQADDCVVNMKRGISCLFGKTALEELCAALDIDMVIRAHEVKGVGDSESLD